ncbi:hypothetical protein GCM10007422_10360 [Pedobacter zeae]|uniref:Uncharacterized protein n=1 Tax=Pedobacter zeae TaxID=1737356 RepID=A0ABQ1XN12_9SPHI|nr:hypothetical protein GCM10007422_10360 [Pedobacter zeae]
MQYKFLTAQKRTKHNNRNQFKVFFTLQNAHPAQTSKQTTLKTAKKQMQYQYSQKMPGDRYLKSSI